jgi:DNA-binding HxlR family transcriptional regulator
MKRLAKTYSCPVEFAIEVLAGKWKSVILAYLKEKPRRYGELRALVPKLSDKVLSERLRDLVELGLVKRVRRAGDKRGSTYELTKRGDSLRPTLEALYAWGETAAPSLGVSIRIPELT